MSEYAHPLEIILGNALPLMTGPILFGNHIVLFTAWLVLRIWFTTGT